jgi:hypothetical protein
MNLADPSRRNQWGFVSNEYQPLPSIDKKGGHRFEKVQSAISKEQYPYKL